MTSGYLKGGALHGGLGADDGDALLAQPILVHVVYVRAQGPDDDAHRAAGRDGGVDGDLGECGSASGGGVALQGHGLGDRVCEGSRQGDELERGLGAVHRARGVGVEVFPEAARDDVGVAAALEVGDELGGGDAPAQPHQLHAAVVVLVVLLHAGFHCVRRDHVATIVLAGSTRTGLFHLIVTLQILLDASDVVRVLLRQYRDLACLLISIVTIPALCLAGGHSWGCIHRPHRSLCPSKWKRCTCG